MGPLGGSHGEETHDISHIVPIGNIHEIEEWVDHTISESVQKADRYKANSRNELDEVMTKSYEFIKNIQRDILIQEHQITDNISSKIVQLRQKIEEVSKRELTDITYIELVGISKQEIDEVIKKLKSTIEQEFIVNKPTSTTEANIKRNKLLDEIEKAKTNVLVLLGSHFEHKGESINAEQQSIIDNIAQRFNSISAEVERIYSETF